MSNSEQVRMLLQRYRQGQCSPEEITIIENWYQQLLDKSDWDFQPGEEALTGERLKARMSERLQPVSAQAPLKALPFYRRKWYKMAAAACLLLLLAAGAWHWLGTTPLQPQKVTPIVLHDAAPGGNKAILTLSNGDHIILDSTSNGQLPPQGNAQVQKSGSGQLVYQASAAATTSIVYNTLTTPRGGQYQLRLPDGTQIWLNAASSITYPTTFTGKDRSVSITGEVYFEVAANAQVPFRVKTGATTIEVLGTHFNVNAYTDEATVNTTLLEGSVKVVRGQQSLLLTPGRQASINAEGVITQPTNVDLDQVMAWKNGKFIFGDKADIYTVMRQIARWYDIEVEYRGAVTQHFWGSMSRETNASQVFKLLEATGGVHFIIEGKKVIVLPSTK
jgi:transmembrane sensor